MLSNKRNLFKMVAALETYAHLTQHTMMNWAKDLFCCSIQLTLGCIAPFACATMVVIGQNALSYGAISGEKSSIFANMLDISTKPTPLCSLSHPLSNESTSTSLAPVLLKLHYLAILIILQLTTLPAVAENI